MTYLSDVGFVIKRVNLGEADRFVTLFTKNNGKVEVLAKGVRKITSRRSSYLEILNLIDFHSVKTSKNFILTEVVLKEPFENRRKTLGECEKLFLISELLEGLCPYGQANSELFSIVNDYLLSGSLSSEGVFSFQKKILVALGYWDERKEFVNGEAINRFIENIVERKIRSNNLTL